MEGVVRRPVAERYLTITLSDGDGTVEQRSRQTRTERIPRGMPGIWANGPLRHRRRVPDGPFRHLHTCQRRPLPDTTLRITTSKITNAPHRERTAIVTPHAGRRWTRPSPG